MFFKVIFKKKFIKNAFLTFFILGVNVFHTYDIGLMWPAPKTFWIRQWLGANITCLLMQWFLNFLKLGTSITFIGLFSSRASSCVTLSRLPVTSHLMSSNRAISITSYVIFR